MEAGPAGGSSGAAADSADHDKCDGVEDCTWKTGDGAAAEAAAPPHQALPPTATNGVDMGRRQAPPRPVGDDDDNFADGQSPDEIIATMKRLEAEVSVRRHALSVF